MKALLPQTFIALVATSLSLQCASAITTAKQLEAWKTEIAQEQASINAKFILKPARALQQKAFEDGGVVWAQRYSESWGGWIYMDWDSASNNLHSRLIRGLKASLMANRRNQSLPEASMIQHRKDMQNFRSRNGKIRRLLNARIQLNVHRALESDKAHQAYLAPVAATIAKAKITAKAMKIKQAYHNKRANEWASFGAHTSAMIRQIGDAQTVDTEKFTKTYKSLLNLGKTGNLPEKAPEKVVAKK